MPDPAHLLPAALAMLCVAAITWVPSVAMAT